MLTKELKTKLLEVLISGVFSLLTEMIKSDHPIAKPVWWLVIGFVTVIGIAVLLQTGVDFIQALKM